MLSNLYKSHQNVLVHLLSVLTIQAYKDEVELDNIINVYDWKTFLRPMHPGIVGISQPHQFLITQNSQGRSSPLIVLIITGNPVVRYKMYGSTDGDYYGDEWNKNQPLLLLNAIPEGQPMAVQPTLDPERLQKVS